MAWSKTKTAIVAGAVLLLATATSITVKEIQKNKTYPWQARGFRDFGSLPSQVTIVPTKFPHWSANEWPGLGAEDDTFEWGLHYPIEGIVETAFGMKPSHTVVSPDVPKERYDFVAKLPGGVKWALAEKLSRQLGITGLIETRQTNVLALRLIPGVGRLKESTRQNSFGASTCIPGFVAVNAAPMSTFSDYLEYLCQIPVVDQTGLIGNYDFYLKWKPDRDSNFENLNETLADKLGLELVPTNMPIEFLVVETVK